MNPPTSSVALYPFLCGKNAPYLKRLPEGSMTVFPATCKTGFAAARTVGLPHAVSATAGVLAGSRIIYGARWVCTGGSVDAVMLPGPSDRLCHICAVKIADDDPGVYRLFGYDGGLLYIGSSARVRERISQHKRMRRWRGLLADATYEIHETPVEARAAEISAIHAEHPALNKLGAASPYHRERSQRDGVAQH